MNLTKPSFKPKCPNHGEYLEGVGFPLKTEGRGICPVSGVPFDFKAEADETTVTKDKFGNTQKTITWKMSGKEKKRSA